MALPTIKKSALNKLDKRAATVCGAIVIAVVVALIASHVFNNSAESSKHTTETSISPNGVIIDGTVPFQPSSKSDYKSAWITYWDDGTGLADFKANAKKLNEIHPFWYEAQSASNIVTQGNSKYRDSVVKIARDAKVQIIPTITETMKTEPFIQMATNNQTRQEHAKAICKLVKDNNYAGIDIDYENFALKVDATTVQQARSAFSSVIGEISKCIHDESKKLHVTVLPKSDDSVYAPYLKSIAPGVFDYKAIGEAADIVRPMAYDYTGPKTGAGSTDPIEWVRAVGDYARRHVPAKKVVLALPLYGYDWNVSGGKPLTARQAGNLSKTTKASVEYNEIAKSRYFEYKASDGTSHQVWFDATEDTKQRIALAKELKLAGVTFWALGNQSTDFFAATS